MAAPYDRFDASTQFRRDADHSGRKAPFVVAFIVAMFVVALGVGASLHRYRHSFG